MMDDKLKELIAFAKTTDLQEVVWEKNGSKISFRRTDVQPARSQTPNPSVVEAESPMEPEVHYIRSTMVGTFFRGDAHERPPLVVEGSQVNSGDSVGSIEAMKIRKDVVAPLGCKIIKALVDDGHSVEYGQPLFEVVPYSGANGHV